MHLSPGKKLDGYEVLNLLGAGGMGEFDDRKQTPALFPGDQGLLFQN
jgi:hypothetical protein